MAISKRNKKRLKTGLKIGAALAAAAIAAKAAHHYGSRPSGSSYNPKSSMSYAEHKISKPVHVTKPGGEMGKSPTVPRQNKPIPVKPKYRK